MSYRRNERDASEWWVGPHEESDSFIGPYDSEAEAIAEGNAEFGEYCIELCLANPEKVYVEFGSGDAESVIEQLGEHLADELYEDAVSDWCYRIPREKYEELAAKINPIILDWLSEQGERIMWPILHTVKRSPITPPRRRDDE